jgi:hypothetical protein
MKPERFSERMIYCSGIVEGLINVVERLEINP